MRVWKKILLKLTLNGFATGGITFFSTTVALNEGSIIAALWAGGLAAGLSFFINLKEAVDKYLKINGSGSNIPTIKKGHKNVTNKNSNILKNMKLACVANCDEEITLQKQILFF